MQAVWGVPKDAASVIRPPSKPMNGLPEHTHMNVTLVIGVHREELGFGIKAARAVEKIVQVVHITKGLSHRKSLYRSGFYHSTAHREMYLQLHQQLKEKTDMVIDLHTGINETGRCADIFSADMSLLHTMKTKLDASAHHPLLSPGEERLYQIMPQDGQKEEEEALFSACHTIIPRQIWEGLEYTYVGLEIYLHETGDGTPVDYEYAAHLISLLSLSRDNTVKD